jgi:hypothetical protein
MSISRFLQAVRLTKLTVFLLLILVSISGCRNNAVYLNNDWGIKVIYPASWEITNEEDDRIIMHMPLQTRIGEASILIRGDFSTPVSSSIEEAVRAELEATVYPDPGQFNRPFTVIYGDPVNTTLKDRDIIRNCAEAFFPLKLVICLVFVQENDNSVLIGAAGNEPAVEKALETIINGLYFIDPDTNHQQ